MSVDYKPHDSAGALASRWLMRSGMLSKPEQFVLDAWMTRTSRDLRNTLDRECYRLYEIGVFDVMPNVRIIPQIETVAEAGARKFLSWTEKCMDAIPDVVRSGFRNLSKMAMDTVNLHNSASDAFSDVVEEKKKPDYDSALWVNNEYMNKNGLNWKRAMLQSATIVLGTPDLKEPFFSAFPTLEQATMFVFHHEAAHGAMLARQTTNPIVAPMKMLAPCESAVEYNDNAVWEQDCWASLLSVSVSQDNQAYASFDEFQARWGEYYADVGAALMHARAGHSHEYLVPLCEARASGSIDHRTDPVLRELVQVLDFHPMVLKETINAEELHEAIGKTIAPQIGRDILTLMEYSSVVGAMMEQALPDLPSTGQLNSEEYLAVNAAMGGQYPKMAFLFAKLQDGPSLAELEVAFQDRAAVSAAQLSMA